MHKRQYLIPDVSAFQDRVGMFANHLLLQVVEHPHPQQHPLLGEERFKCSNADGFPMYTQIKKHGLYSLVALVLEVFTVAVIQEEGIRIVLANPLHLLNVKCALGFYPLTLPASWNRDRQT